MALLDIINGSLLILVCVVQSSLVMRRQGRPDVTLTRCLSLSLCMCIRVFTGTFIQRWLVCFISFRFVSFLSLSLILFSLLNIHGHRKDFTLGDSSQRLLLHEGCISSSSNSTSNDNDEQITWWCVAKRRNTCETT